MFPEHDVTTPRDDRPYEHLARDIAANIEEFLWDYNLYDDQIDLLVSPDQDETGISSVSVYARSSGGPDKARGVTHLYDASEAFPGHDYATVRDEIYPTVVDVFHDLFPGADIQAYDPADPLTDPAIGPSFPSEYR